MVEKPPASANGAVMPAMGAEEGGNPSGPDEKTSSVSAVRPPDAPRRRA